jgi:hypothetical protein
MNLFRNLFARDQGMVGIPADTYGCRMPLWPLTWRGDEIENSFDGVAYLNAIVNARHPHASFAASKKPVTFSLGTILSR